MAEIIVPAVLIVFALLAALAAVIGLAGAVHVVSRRDEGYFHYAIYAILLSSAVAILLSHRNLALSSFNVQVVVEAARSPIDAWVQRLASAFLVVTAGERILRGIGAAAAGRQHGPAFLLPAYILFWFGTVATAALWGAYPMLSHNYIYTLLIGSAAILMSTRESELAIKAARNAILVLILVSLLLLPVIPHVLIDTSYAQGFLRGLPRLAGLTPHALSLGMLAQLVLLLLWAFPLERVWLNRLAWLMAGAVLFLAQSKTAWVSFIVAAFCMALTRHGAGIKRRFNDSRRPAFAVATVIVGMVLVLIVSATLLLGDVGQRISRFVASDEGAQLTSLTGRDLIWRVALDEWQRNPVFGYGPGLFDEAHRASIHMGNATSGHNQFVDTLARSGTVGAAALTIYLLVLLALAVRHARSSGGLTLALFAIIALRSVSEVPLNLFSYGPESALQLVLLMALAGEARKKEDPATSKRHAPLASVAAAQFYGARKR